MLAVAFLLLAVVLCVYLGATSQVAPAPKVNCSVSQVDPSFSNAAAQRCLKSVEAYTLWTYNAPWWRDTWFTVAEAFAVIAGLCLLRFPKTKFKLLVRLPKVVRYVALVEAACSLSIFAVYAVAGIRASSTSVITFVDYGVNSRFAFEALLASVFCIAVYGLGKGTWSAFKDAVSIGAIAVVLFEAGLFIFGRIWMPLYVTTFTTWSVSGVSVLSNWFVLFVSGFLALYSRPWRALRK